MKKTKQDLSLTKKIMLIVACVVLAVAGYAGYMFFNGKTSVKAISEEELKQTVSKLPVLYTIEAVSEVYVTHQDAESSVRSWFGNRSIVVPLKANIKAGIDLSKVQVSLHPTEQTAEFTLPEPLIEIESDEIQWDKLQEDVGFLRQSYTVNEKQQIAKMGKDKIQNSLYKMDLIEPTIKQAQDVITGLCNKVGLKATFTPATTKYDTAEAIAKIIKQ